MFRKIFLVVKELQGIPFWIFDSQAAKEIQMKEQTKITKTLSSMEPWCEETKLLVPWRIVQWIFQEHIVE